MSSNLFTSTVHAEDQKLLACVHCGLCLEACPTYTATGDENDGPRGRLYLMRAVAEDRLDVNSLSFERHIDRCLGCRACESVCPAGVQYGELLEASRGLLFDRDAQRGSSYKLLRFALRHIWLHPGRLSLAFRSARLFRDLRLPRLMRKTGISKLLGAEFSLALLESSAPTRTSTSSTNESSGRKSDGRAEGPVAMLFKGCVGEGLFARVNRATERVLEVNGYSVASPTAEVCCGALHAHAGDLAGARALARQNIEAFQNDEVPIVTNAGGCGAMLLSYAHLLAADDTLKESAKRFSDRVRDVGQLLRAQTDLQTGKTPDEVVTYDASCHLLYAQHASDDSLATLRTIPQLNFVPLKDAERCCGGAGVYNLLESDLSDAILREKLACIRESGAETLVTGNPGCQMQIGAGARLNGMNLRVCHPVELLDESYRLAGKYDD